MHTTLPAGLPPGVSVLGGAAAGLSYEGVWHDALGREEMARRKQVALVLRRTAPMARPVRSEAAPARREPELAR